MIRNITIIALLLYCSSTWYFTWTGYMTLFQPSYSADETKEMDVAFMPPRINPISLPPIVGINR